MVGPTCRFAAAPSRAPPTISEMTFGNLSRSRNASISSCRVGDIETSGANAPPRSGVGSIPGQNPQKRALEAHFFTRFARFARLALTLFREVVHRPIREQPV